MRTLWSPLNIFKSRFTVSNRFVSYSGIDSIMCILYHSQTYARMHPQKLNIVMDGRLRSAPSDARPFSLFFAIPRIEKDEKSTKANLTLEYSSLSVPDITLTMPSGMKTKFACPNLPQIPVMYNKLMIKAHTQLFAPPDLSLQKVNNKLATKRAADLKAEHDKAKKAKTEPPEGAE